jgi:CheY-like chemotaxis protein
MGHVVCVIATTEAQAVAEAAHCKPDLMIVDASLREGSGVAAVEEILRAGFVPQVFVSGDAESVRALRPGAIVMEKPCRDLQFGNAIQQALAGTRQT